MHNSQLIIIALVLLGRTIPTSSLLTASTHAQVSSPTHLCFFYSRIKSTKCPSTACSTHRQAVYKDSHSNLKIAAFKTPPPQESDLWRGIFCLYLSGGGTIMRKEPVRRKPPKCEFCWHNCNQNCVIMAMIVVQILFAYLLTLYLITLSVSQLTKGRIYYY